jgi:hypothetical protein
MKSNTMGAPEKALPDPESAAGRLYALLRANAGHIVRGGIDLSKKRKDNALTVLRDFYGCDIRSKKGNGGWLMLAGEYHGRDYIDYCAAEFEKGSK